MADADDRFVVKRDDGTERTYRSSADIDAGERQYNADRAAETAKKDAEFYRRIDDVPLSTGRVMLASVVILLVVGFFFGARAWDWATSPGNSSATDQYLRGVAPMTGALRAHESAAAATFEVLRSGAHSKADDDAGIATIQREANATAGATAGLNSFLVPEIPEDTHQAAQAAHDALAALPDAIARASGDAAECLAQERDGANRADVSACAQAAREFAQCSTLLAQAGGAT